MLRQQITSEVLEWIARQAQAGHKPEAVLDAMRSGGWHDDVARDAVQRAQHGSLTEAPPPVPVPEPMPSGASWIVHTPDRDVAVLASMQRPRIVVFGGLLSAAECDALIELAHPRLQRSHTVDNWSGGDHLSEWRTSEGAFFEPGANELLLRVESRIAALVSWPQECGEGMQVLRYGVGAEYRPHHDYFDPTVPGAAALLKRGGPRVATLIMYLNTPLRGGSTTFPEVDFDTAPVKGNAVFFSYSSPHPATRTLHGGAPVLEGEKWIATKWLRAEAFSR